MAKRFTERMADGTAIEFEFRHNWFRNSIVGQPGVTSMLGGEAARVASTASSRTNARASGMRNPPYMSAVDWNNGWPHGRAWASNPVSINHEAVHKTLSTCL